MKEGYTGITISENVYQKIKEAMQDINEKSGFRRFRSVAHFVEESTIGFVYNFRKKKAEDLQELINTLVYLVGDNKEVFQMVLKKISESDPEQLVEEIRKYVGPEKFDELATAFSSDVKLEK